MAGLVDRLDGIRAAIDRHAGSRRVTIVAVTKGWPVDVSAAAVEAGLTDLGENYARELAAKAETLAAGADGAGLPRWHYLGAVQRQAATLGSLVTLWHGVDSERAGLRIGRHHPGAKVLVQVNLSGDPARNGCSWDTAAGLVESLGGAGLDVRGLMGVAGTDPRKEFRRLAALAATLDLDELSMGMSSDFEIAVDEGATMVRLGTALFGPRPARSEVRR